MCVCVWPYISYIGFTVFTRAGPRSRFQAGSGSTDPVDLSPRPLMAWQVDRPKWTTLAGRRCPFEGTAGYTWLFLFSGWSGLRVAGCGFRVSGWSGFRVSGFGFQDPDFRIRVSSFEIRVSGFGVERTAGVGFKPRVVSEHLHHARSLRLPAQRKSWIPKVTFGKS